MRTKTHIRKKIQTQSLFLKPVLLLKDFEIIGHVTKYNFLPLSLYVYVCGAFVHRNQIITLENFYFFSLTYQKTDFSF